MGLLPIWKTIYGTIFAVSKALILYLVAITRLVWEQRDTPLEVARDAARLDPFVKPRLHDAPCTPRPRHCAASNFFLQGFLS
jgi:hypothetical protein